jgi:hypothetical protein
MSIDEFYHFDVSLLVFRIYRVNRPPSISWMWARGVSPSQAAKAVSEGVVVAASLS